MKTDKKGRMQEIPPSLNESIHFILSKSFPDKRCVYIYVHIIPSQKVCFTVLLQGKKI